MLRGSSTSNGRKRICARHDSHFPCTAHTAVFSAPYLTLPDLIAEAAEVGGCPQHILPHCLCIMLNNLTELAEIPIMPETIMECAPRVHSSLLVIISHFLQRCATVTEFQQSTPR